VREGAFVARYPMPSLTVNPRHNATRSRSFASRPTPASSKNDQEPPELPKFSLDGLGATPRIKFFIYTAITIMGAAETYTYSLWIWHKLKPETGANEQGDVPS